MPVHKSMNTPSMASSGLDRKEIKVKIQKQYIIRKSKSMFGQVTVQYRDVPPQMFIFIPNNKMQLKLPEHVTT